MIYLDYNAGAPTRRDVIEAMVRAMEIGGNPSSVHAQGRKARALLEDARTKVAAAVNADPAALTFTSGGTESNALVLGGTEATRVLVSAVEHASVLEFPNVEIVPVDGHGRVDLDVLAQMLASDSRKTLVSVMIANNETGVIQPTSEISELVRKHGGLIHCDGCQAPGRLTVDMKDLDVDFLTLSAHKLGGPAGIGAVVRKSTDLELHPFLFGGGQEKRKRAGTENLVGAVGFGTAITSALAEQKDGKVEALCKLQDQLERNALAMVPGAMVLGKGVERLCNTTCLALPGVSSQTQVMALDLANVAISAGSACSSGKVSESKVLKAMGLGTEICGSAVRVSFGWGSTESDIETFLTAWSQLAQRKGFEVKNAAQDADFARRKQA